MFAIDGLWLVFKAVASRLRSVLPLGGAYRSRRQGLGGILGAVSVALLGREIDRCK